MEQQGSTGDFGVNLASICECDIWKLSVVSRRIHWYKVRVNVILQSKVMSINVILCFLGPECFKCSIRCQFLINVGELGMKWMRFSKALPMRYYPQSNLKFTKSYDQKTNETHKKTQLSGRHHIGCNSKTPPCVSLIFSG